MIGVGIECVGDRAAGGPLVQPPGRVPGRANDDLVAVRGDVGGREPGGVGQNVVISSQRRRAARRLRIRGAINVLRVFALGDDVNISGQRIDEHALRIAGAVGICERELDRAGERSA